MNLKLLAVKEEVLEYHRSGLSQSIISELTGIPKTTIGDFISGRTHSLWWSQQNGLPSSDTIPKEVIPTEIRTEIVPIRIETTLVVKNNCRHMMLPDLQAKPDIDFSYFSWIGDYMADKKPDVIINIGDHWDLPSLSAYDRATKKAEGRRLNLDIEAGIIAMNLLLGPIAKLQAEELAKYGAVRYKPKMVFTTGNHEERLMRHVNANPNLAGLVSYDDFKLKENGWEVYDFLEPAIISGITYCHFMANPMTGKPLGGAALNILKHVGESFTMGHKQLLDVATRTLPASGKQQWAIIAGAGYPHDEDYKGHQGNKHWRGIVLKDNVEDGSFNPRFIELKDLKKRYEEKYS
jgi:hypothetical protein